MPSSYYTPTGNPVAQNRGTSPAMRAEFALIDTALQKLPSPQAINSAAGNYFNDTGTANAYVVAMSAQVTTLTAGLAVSFKAANANTGASTLTLTGVAAVVPIVGPDGVTPLAANAIAAGSIVDVRYDGVNFQLRSGLLAGTQSPSAIQAQTYTAVTTSGTSTAYTAAPTPALLAYAANESFFVTFHATSGSSPTLAISGLASPPQLVRQIYDGTYGNIGLGEIPAGHCSRVTLLSTTQALVEDMPQSAAAAGSQNAVINSGCLIAQRGTVNIAASGNFYGGCDRYLTSITGSTVSAIVLQAATPAPSMGHMSFAHLLGNLLTTGATTLTFSQRIEAKHAIRFNSKTVTFTGKVYQTSGSTVTVVPTISKANSADNFGVLTTLATSAGVSVPNATATTISITVALGSADASNGLQLSLGSTVGAQATVNWYTADWHFDVGTAAPTFPGIVNISTEFDRCARYYWEPAAAAAGLASSTTVGIFAWQYPVPMRTAPSFAAKATTSTISSSGSTAAIAGTWASSNIGLEGVTATFTRGGGVWTAGDALVLNDAAGTHPFTLSAEL